MTRLLFLTIVLFFITSLSSCAFGDENKPTEQEIKAAIDNLVSPNPKPIGDVDNNEPAQPRNTPGFDAKKQQPVNKAFTDLRKMGTQAFPLLIERWDDERYSLTMASALSGYDHNYNVGKVCQVVLFDQLQPYGYWQSNSGRDPRGKATRPMYPKEFLSSKEEAKKWWDKNKDKSLAQIQLEILDWVVAEEAKEEKKYSEEERKALQKIRRQLTNGKKPLPPGNYYAFERD